MKPATVDEAIALLRSIAAERASEAERVTAMAGWDAAQWMRNESIYFEAAANVIEAGEYLGFAYSEDHPT